MFCFCVVQVFVCGWGVFVSWCCMDLERRCQAFALLLLDCSYNQVWCMFLLLLQRWFVFVLFCLKISFFVLFVYVLFRSKIVVTWDLRLILQWFVFKNPKGACDSITWKGMIILTRKDRLTNVLDSSLDLISYTSV